jgi:hypothetical protein
VDFHLWSEGSRVGEFHDRSQALAMVREIAEEDLREANRLVLTTLDERGHPVQVASGYALVTMANQETT